MFFPYFIIKLMGCLNIHALLHGLFHR